MYSIIDNEDDEVTFYFKKTNEIDTCIVNTIRRVAMSNLNIFALPDDKINISANTCILNNDQLKHRISLLPLFKIPNIDNDSLIQIGVNKHNDTSDVMSITTNDCIVKVNNKLTPNNFPKEPILICKIKPTQKIEFVATSEYNNAFDCKNNKVSNIFCPSKMSYFDEDEESFKLTIETTGQLTGHEILIESCKYCMQRLNKLLSTVLKENTLDGSTIEKLVINDENDTMGHLLAHHLQRNKFIKYAAYKVDHPSDDFIVLAITTDGSKTVEESLKITVKDIQLIFDKILKTKLA